MNFKKITFKRGKKKKKKKGSVNVAGITTVVGANPN